MMSGLEAAIERLARRKRLYPHGEKEIKEYITGPESFASDCGTLARDYPRVAAENAALRKAVRELRAACIKANVWIAFCDPRIEPSLRAAGADVGKQIDSALAATAEFDHAEQE